MKYIILTQRLAYDETLGDYYLEFGEEDIFDNEFDATSLMNELIDGEVEVLNEDSPFEDTQTSYRRSGNLIYDNHNNLIAAYFVQQVTLPITSI